MTGSATMTSPHPLQSRLKDKRTRSEHSLSGGSGIGSGFKRTAVDIFRSRPAKAVVKEVNAVVRKFR